MSAKIPNLYRELYARSVAIRLGRNCIKENTYSAHPEVAQDTSTPASHRTPVFDLRIASVAVHLRELELCLGANTLGERRVADNVAESLPVMEIQISQSFSL